MSSTVASFGRLIVFEIAPEMNGCAAAIMRMWPSTAMIALAVRAALVGAIEDGQVLGLQMRRAFDASWRPQTCVVGFVDLGFVKPRWRENVERSDALSCSPVRRALR